MTAAVVPLRPGRHDVLVSIPQSQGPAFQVGPAATGAWAGRPRLSTSHIPAPDIPDVVRGLLRAVETDPAADHTVIADLLDVLALHGYSDNPDTVA